MTAKVYVDVLAVFSREGELIPTAFVWEDGHRYEIVTLDIVIPVRWVEKSAT